VAGKSCPNDQDNVFSRKIEQLVESNDLDGIVKNSRCKAHKSLGMKRTWQYAAMTKDEVQRRRWTFYDAVSRKIETIK
jgi:hypothetical protein